MIIEQQRYSESNGWQLIRDGGTDPSEFQIVLAFGHAALLSDERTYHTVRSMYPKADILMNTTAGEILDVEVSDGIIALTAICLEQSHHQVSFISMDDVKSSFEAGYRLASSLQREELKSVLVISDGQKVNGSELVMGLQDFLPGDIIITGGLAGDGTRFKTTLVGLNESPVEGRIVAVGFYGSALGVTYGSMGGWDPFGPERLITKSAANVLYELDGKPALDIYKMYLGEYANELPGSGLLFPLSIRMDNSANAIVRTILSVNEEEKSLTFAGNMPRGSYARLMKASMDRLIEGASNAAQHAMKNTEHHPDLAILISCVGRKLVLDQRIEEEVEVVRAIYGSHTAITGFYSYGEIAPSFNFLQCDLHNQTMTITTISEYK